MQTCDHRFYDLSRRAAHRPMCARPPKITPAALCLVASCEMDSLRLALRRGNLPLDFRAKLDRLRAEDLREYYLKHTSALLISLLAAAEAGTFGPARPEDCESLLRTLAYLRKDDDAIPDAWPGGFEDDHDLMRWVCSERRPLLDAYKAWHLSHGVPSLWLPSCVSRRNADASF